MDNDDARNIKDTGTRHWKLGLLGGWRRQDDNAQQSFESARSIDSVNSLEIVLSTFSDPLAANIGLFNLCHHLTYLTHLRIHLFPKNAQSGEHGVNLCGYITQLVDT